MLEANICYFVAVDLLRNDLFVTLLKADIDKPSKTAQTAVEMIRLKSSPKNIELRIIVLDREGKELQVNFYFDRIPIFIHTAS